MAGSHLGREESLNPFSTGVENIPLLETGVFVKVGLVFNRSVLFNSVGKSLLISHPHTRAIAPAVSAVQVIKK